MAGAMFEVGAAFIVEDRASGPLAEIARAFESLAELATSLQEKLTTIGEGAFSGMLAGVDRASVAMDRMIAQADSVAAAWDRAAAAGERAGAGPGGGRGGGTAAGGEDGRAGRGPGPGDEARRIAEDRRNAEWENRNLDQIYARDYALGQRENANRDRMGGGGLYGPPEGDVFGGYDGAGRLNQRFDRDQRLNAEAENAEIDRVARTRQGSRASSGAHGRASIGESGISGHAGMDIGLGTLAAGWAAFKSGESAMEEQKNITETLAGVNVTPDDPKFQEDYDRLHKMLYDKTKGTKYSNLMASKIMLESLPTLGLTGDASVAAATDTDVFQTALNAGELSAFRGKGDPGAEAKASFQFAHLTGEFEPGKMSALVDMVNAIAFRTGTSISQQESIMKYAAPIGLLAGMPAQDVVGMVGSAENRLGDTSTAGTGFSQFILGGMAWKGQTAHGLSPRQRSSAHAAERELEAAVRLDPSLAREHDVARTQAGLNRHDQAIVDLKIRDAAGHLLPGARNAKGDYSEAGVETLIKDYASNHSKEEVTRIMSAAFETRGARFAQPFTTAEGIAREHQQMASYANAPSVKKELETLQNLPIQQFEQMLANLANTGNILATETLGPLNAVFKTTNSLLIGFNDWLTSHQTAAAAVGDTALAVGGATALALAGTAGRWLYRNTGARALYRGARSIMSTPSAQAGGADLLGESLLSEGGAAAGLGLSGLVGGGLLAGGVGAYYGGEWMKANLPEWVTGSKKAGADMEFRSMHGGMPPWSASRQPTPQASAPAPITVTLGPITMNGVPDDSSLRGIIAKLVDGLKGALTRATADGHGSTELSPYSLGGGGW